MLYPSKTRFCWGFQWNLFYRFGQMLMNAPCLKPCQPDSQITFKFTQIAKKVVISTHIQLTCDQLVSTCVGWPNGEKLASTCIRIWVRPKSTQVGGQTKRTSWTCVDMRASTCESVWPLGFSNIWGRTSLFILFSELVGTVRCFERQ